jgi:hypothetical protein
MCGRVGTSQIQRVSGVCQVQKRSHRAARRRQAAQDSPRQVQQLVDDCTFHSEYVKY